MGFQRAIAQVSTSIRHAYKVYPMWQVIFFRELGKNSSNPPAYLIADYGISKPFTQAKG